VITRALPSDPAYKIALYKSKIAHYYDNQSVNWENCQLPPQEAMSNPLPGMLGEGYECKRSMLEGNMYHYLAFAHLDLGGFSQ